MSLAKAEHQCYYINPSHELINQSKGQTPTKDFT